MELSHLLSLVSELPKNSTLRYVRSDEECTFLDVDIEGKRIYTIVPNGEKRSWAPSYLEELASKIYENEPFNLSGLLNNKGSNRPVLETIIAHTREFYTVRQGTATALVWIPSKPKKALSLEGISKSEIPASKRNVAVDVVIKNELKKEYTIKELANILKNMQQAKGPVGIHLFGLKYGKFLSQFPLKDIVDASGISSSFSVELNKMRNVYNEIRQNAYGLAFLENAKPLSELIQSSDVSESHTSYLRAMRTKPFLLLAGISGTGKSRIVKQMAFDSCPTDGQLAIDPTSPGNYCLVEVKPNWHDSSELLGYRSNIGGAHYVLTPFVKFLAKAMLHPDVPFFVCLDEMNLAPVEQYFAEFLSVLESRTKVNGKIVSEPLIKEEVFVSLTNASDLFNMDKVAEIYKNRPDDMPTEYQNAFSVYETLKAEGLRIPENVVVIGTVNMDETTHQFSRKVIDRAMTIEMNLPEGNPFMDFFSNSSQLAYREAPLSRELYLASEVRASDVVEALSAEDAEKTEWLKSAVAKFLTDLNAALDGTPFKVAYRVENELMLYFYQVWLEDKESDWENILNISCDQILMMKVLPRIEGDEELLEKPLGRLAEFCHPYGNASKKISEMSQRLSQSRFTSFWP